MGIQERVLRRIWEFVQIRVVERLLWGQWIEVTEGEEISRMQLDKRRDSFNSFGKKEWGIQWKW
jgi:hypothetical protein